MDVCRRAASGAHSSDVPQEYAKAGHQLFRRGCSHWRGREQHLLRHAPHPRCNQRKGAESHSRVSPSIDRSTNTSHGIRCCLQMGQFLHYVSTFIAGFAVGFSMLWKLGLVTLAVAPAIAMAGGSYAYVLTGFAARNREAYEEAGNIAEQSLANVRTVYSFVGEQKAAGSFGNALRRTLRLGYKSGLTRGLGMGITHLVLFCCYALLLWYGGVLVRNGEANGGKALATIFSVIVGGM